MKTIVISQPMLFPWVGLFEQVRLADVFVHYDDVQFPLGRSFISRVQIKTAEGSQWLTVPVLRKAGQLIKDVRTDDAQDWRAKHLRTLNQAYAKAPHLAEMIAIVERIYAEKTSFLADMTIQATEEIARYFSLTPQFIRASTRPASGRSSDRLLWWMEELQGELYVTGHGAYGYLAHELFEARSMRVEYMNYQKVPYPQLHGPFTPFVSILDLIANTGRGGAAMLCSGSKPWREFTPPTPAPVEESS